MESLLAQLMYKHFLCKTTADKIAFAEAVTLGEDWVQTALG